MFFAGCVTMWAGCGLGSAVMVSQGLCVVPADSDSACTAAAFMHAPSCAQEANRIGDSCEKSAAVPWTREWFQTKPYAVEALATCTADPRCDRAAAAEMYGGLDAEDGEKCWDCKEKSQMGNDCEGEDKGFDGIDCSLFRGLQSNEETACTVVTADESTGRISGCMDFCSRNFCSPLRSSNLFIKEVVFGAILGRVLSFVSGQANYDTSIHSIRAGTGPRCCFVGCGPPVLAVVWLAVGTLFCSLLLAAPLSKLPMLFIGYFVQQLVADCVVFSWIDTATACLLGWHDAKKKIGIVPEEADEEPGPVTVSNPVDKSGGETVDADDSPGDSPEAAK